jgi:hypothetical protein
LQHTVAEWIPVIAYFVPGLETSDFVVKVNFVAEKLAWSMLAVAAAVVLLASFADFEQWAELVECSVVYLLMCQVLVEQFVFAELQ